MNREILLRAKHKQGGIWLTGVPMKIENKHVLLLEDTENLLRVHYIDYEMYLAETYAVEIEENTLCQYTGVTDKNGKKIFEGDIVEFYFFDKTRRNGELVEVKNTKTMLIEWHSASFYMKELFRNYRLNTEMEIITEKIYAYRCERKQGVYKTNSFYFVEVIGNIHDNPELLKGGEEYE